MDDTTKILYNIGDKIWWARSRTEEVQRICPVCYGKKTVTLILGNDEQVMMPCDYCAKGYAPPSGYIHEYEWIAEPQLVSITGMRSESDCFKESREYYVGRYVLYDDDIFDSKEAATEKCALAIEEHYAEQQRRAGCSKQGRYSWSVGYHMKQIKKLEREIDYHRANVQLCKDSRYGKP